MTDEEIHQFYVYLTKSLKGRRCIWCNRVMQEADILIGFTPSEKSTIIQHRACHPYFGK
jgi:hypothetical protein